MRARFLEKSEEKKWDEFVKTHPLKSIHQSVTWGHFQEKVPRRGKYWIVVLEEEKNGQKKIIGGSMIIRHGLPKNYSWLYSARGPLLDYDSPQINDQLKAIFEILKPLAAKENAIFYRIDPALPLPSLAKFSHAYANNLGFQPEHTIILDLTLSEEELLKQMKPKGRYNIRLAEKKGVTVRLSDPKNKAQFEKDLTAFHKILHETQIRDKFYGHKKDFYRNMIQVLAPDKAHLYVAEYQNKIIAAIIATFYEDTGTYYYGASGNEHREVMAPYLLQWTAIKEAQKRGCKTYDFLGIAPPNTKNHPWQGVTDYKKKFGGQEVSVIPPQDFPFKKFAYFLFRIYKWIKK